MQVLPLAHDFPSKHMTFSGLLAVLVGLFTFIISCVYAGGIFIGTLICCLFLTIVGVFLILTGLYVLKPIVENTLIQMVLIGLGLLFAFISFCIFCAVADATSAMTVSTNSTFTFLGQYLIGNHRKYKLYFHISGTIFDRFITLFEHHLSAAAYPSYARFRPTFIHRQPLSFKHYPHNDNVDKSRKDCDNHHHH
ncbi:Hypothetical predicted protein [Octopus vulgaris]|uniref:Uncharacterized protein n=1 Tax=Octopus vulgaris TaxID=6645 RepID=A0AA36FEG3_OCTVU|nr:Hypothetical predicted protein [Octopus vulgaris]